MCRKFLMRGFNRFFCPAKMGNIALMVYRNVYISFLFSLIAFLPVAEAAVRPPEEVVISTPKMAITLDYGDKASIVSLSIDGKQVIGSADGIYTAVTVGGTTYSSLHLMGKPVKEQYANRMVIRGIRYGKGALAIDERWTFTRRGESIEWAIDRSFSKAVNVDEAAMPVMNFDHVDTWEGAFQGYGGLAWFYLFNERLCTYGVHTTSSSFWNSKTGDGLTISVEAPGKKVSMKYTRTLEDRLRYTVTVSDRDMVPLHDSGTNRRRFIRKESAVWAPFHMPAGRSVQRISFRYFDFQEKYGRGKFTGIDGGQVSAVLNTIARIGVIDSLHFGGNSWHTPYGPICLHEQYIANLGLGIDDPDYLRGYRSCLDFYRDHAIKPDGRVYPRWAYANEDAMPGRFNEDGFYEAQWGILMDSNPDYVSNVVDEYDMTGDLNWVKTHQSSCEKALEWILNRDENHNGLVEMMTDGPGQKRGSDWIDIIWASYENAFVNAKLYHALVGWAAIESQLNNADKARRYEDFAALLKTSFNKPVQDGGFWDSENGCYVHWRDKDHSIHGRNMVTPVNFMAIAYGICDDSARKKAILDSIEMQMQRERLFFWPICLRSYVPGEGNDWQFPFPNYENGDLFLSWGSIGVKAYADYDPAIALKYVRNVLAQYAKDGLAFQRYGRRKQDGLGDDILSGNSLAIVGLYQSIYGIHPLYNRLYLDPHITEELNGTELKYRIRGQRLTISLDKGGYAVSDSNFKIRCGRGFGFYAQKGRLFYFDGGDSVASLAVSADGPLTLVIHQWSAGRMEWEQMADVHAGKRPTSRVRRLQPETTYRIAFDDKPVERVKSDTNGELVLSPVFARGTGKIVVEKED